MKQLDTSVPRESETVSRLLHYATRCGVFTGPAVGNQVKEPASLQSQVVDPATRGVFEGVVVVLHRVPTLCVVCCVVCVIWCVLCGVCLLCVV